MTRNDDRDGVRCVGLADRARGALQRIRDLRVGSRLAIGNVAQGAPDALLEVGAARRHRQIEVAALPVKIAEELAARFLQQRCGGLLGAPSPFDRDDRAVFLEDGQLADRTVKRKLRHARVMALSVAGADGRPGDAPLSSERGATRDGWVCSIMEFESAVSIFRNTYGRPPEEAVRVAVAHAAQLSPLVLALLETGAAGEMLTWQEENLLFTGLFVLAEAKRREVFRPLLTLLASDPAIAAGVFDEDFMRFDALLLTLADDDAGPLLTLAGDIETRSELRTAAFRALTGLVLDGRADRDAFIRVLDAVDADPEEIEHPAIWWAWADAIAGLRLREFIPRVRRMVDDGRFFAHRETDWVHWLGLFDMPEPFRPVGEIADAMASLRECATPDEPQAFRVPRHLLNWLERALKQQPDVLSLEKIDGFLTGTLCGPAPWPGADGTIREAWIQGITRAEVKQEARRLLRARFAEIENQLQSNNAPDPFLHTLPGFKPGELWASGFLEYVLETQQSWMRLTQHPAGSALIVLLLAVAGVHRKGGELRDDIWNNLGELALDIRRFWTEGAPRWAITALKAGRNDPCPCGSGRKFKKCCASVEARMMQAAE